MRRIDLKTGFSCNNRCVFCVQGDKRSRHEDKSTDALRALLDEARARADSVVFTGGEVTIRPDLAELVAHARARGFRTIQIQTNGRMLAYPELCRRLIEAGATEFSPALHGHTPELHDRLTGVTGSFAQTVRGIRQLTRRRVPVLTNSVIVRDNAPHLPDLADLLVVLGVDQFQLAFVHPLGRAAEQFDRVVPRFSEIAAPIRAALERGRRAGRRVMTEAIPLCFLRGCEDVAAERVIPRTTIYDADSVLDDYTEYRWNEGKVKGPPCTDCAVAAWCEGPWREYPERFGWEEFQPVDAAAAPAVARRLGVAMPDPPADEAPRPAGAPPRAATPVEAPAPPAPAPPVEARPAVPVTPAAAPSAAGPRDAPMARPSPLNRSEAAMGAMPYEDKHPGAVAVTAHCNVRCLFCTGYDDTPLPFEELTRLVSGRDELFLQGGEPTLHPRLPELIAHARAHGTRRVVLVTNGLRLASKAHLRRLADAGVDEYFFNFPAHREALLDRLVQRPGAWRLKVQAFENFKALGLARRLRLVNVLTTENVGALPGYARWVAGRCSELAGVELKLAQCLGRAAENAALIPRLTDLEPMLHEALDVLRDHGVRTLTNGVPACFLGAHCACAIEGDVRRAGATLTARTLPDACRNCPRTPWCLGPRADYVVLYGDGECSPSRAGAPPAAVRTGASSVVSDPGRAR